MTSGHYDPEGDGYRLVFAFPDQSPSFGNGFTCGRIYAAMLMRPDAEHQFTVIDEARTTIEAMAMALGWVEAFEAVGDGWLRVTLTPPPRR